jgi:hypothetical protein
LVDTALYVLSRTIKFYAIPFGGNEVRVIFEYLTFLLGRNPAGIIVMRIFAVIMSMVGCEKAPPEFFIGHYETIMNLSRVACARGDAFGMGIYSMVHNVIAEFVRRSPREFVQRPEMTTLVQETILRLEQLKSMDDNTFAIQEGGLRILDYAFLVFRQVGLPGTEALGARAVRLCFHLMRDRNREIWENALITLIIVIRSMSSSAADIYDGERVRSLVGEALLSRSPSIISGTVWALSSLYAELVGQHDGPHQRQLSIPAQDLLSKLPDTFSLVQECLSENDFPRDFHVHVLLALAGIIQACAKHITPEDAYRLFDMYERLLPNVVYDRMTDDDREYGNRVFQAVFRGYAALVKAFGESIAQGRINDADARIIMRRVLVGAPGKFLLLGDFSKLGELQSYALHAFIELLKTFDDVFKRNGNIILNRYHTKLLIWHASASDDAKLREQAEQIRQVVKKA